MFKNIILISIAGICIFFLYACGPKVKVPEAELDTPYHHVITGNKLLQKADQLDQALREFNRAKELDPTFSSAYSGIGLVHAMKGDFELALKMMRKAHKYTRGDEQKVGVSLGYMRLYSIGREKLDNAWLDKVESRFIKVIKIAPELAEPYFYMGKAYKMAYRFSEATAQFTKVLNLNKGFIAEADKEYAEIQTIERAMPGTKIGKKIALLDKITRADSAALFIEELKIDELFEKRVRKQFDTSFKSPEKQFRKKQSGGVSLHKDINNHVLRADIEAVLAVGIKGLQLFPDHTYHPDKPITRAEFAIMLEDILIKILRDDSLATKFIGSPSPFPDLRNDLPYYNAVMIVTTRDIMEIRDTVTGEFDPMGVVSGAEALLSIRILKTIIENLSL